MSTEFRGKTWIYRVQAIFCGGMGGFGLVFGPLFLSGLMKKANGDPATDAGVALTAMSVLFLAVFAMAIFNIKARRRPLLRICREGVEVVQVAPSSLDRIPLVPGLVRVAWLILSTQGFRRRIIRFPWRDLQEVLVSGPPMARSLTIVAYPSFLATADLPPGIFAADRVVFPEVTFASPLDEIARAVRSSANLPATPGHLPSWSEPATTA